MIAGMTRRRMPWLILAFAAGLCLAGMPSWMAPYNRGGLLDPLMITGLAGLSALAMMLIVGGIASPLRVWAVMAFCPPVAASVRAAMEMPAIPVWAGDIGLAALVGATVVAPGILAGRIAQRLQQSRRRA